MTAPDPTAGEHRRASNGPDALDTCTGCDWESWDTAPSFADHPGAGDPKNSEGVGTGAGDGATGQVTGAAWVNRSTDCPEAPAQAHPLGPDGFTGLASDADYRAAFYRVLERCEELKTSVAEHQWNALERAREADLATARAESAEAAHAALVAAVEALADEWEGWAKRRATTRIYAFRDAAETLRALIAREG